MKIQVLFSKSSSSLIVSTVSNILVDVLDGAMIVLAIYCTLAVHPGSVLGGSKAKQATIA